MITAGRALEIAWGLVRRSGLCVIAPSLLAAIVADVRNGSWNAGAARSAEEDEPVRKKRVNLELVSVGVSHCVLEGKAGEQLLEVDYARDESLGVRFGSAFPVQLGCNAAPDGTYRLNVQHRDSVYRLRLCPDGVSGFTVTRLDDNETRGLGLTDSDEFVTHPSLIK